MTFFANYRKILLNGEKFRLFRAGFYFGENMLEEYVQKGVRKLRCGYTTGSCAAAAAKAAAFMLLRREILPRVSLVTPKGIALELDTEEPTISADFASCGIRKDGGDDPDVTDGITVFARVELRPAGVEIVGGEGVGVVTKDGLDQPKGAAAINSVPRRMIAAAVNEIAEECGYGGGFRVAVSVPDGAELAKRTYNPRMGIEGGISIIGTSGIVEPMSTAALIDTIRLEQRMRRAEGCRDLLLTLGNYGADFLRRELPYALDKSVKCGNFIGEAIDLALENGFESVLIVGHIGKLVKLGAGIMNTHSAQADGRIDVLVTCGVLAGADPEALRALPECATVDAAIAVLSETGRLPETLEILGKRAQSYLDAKVKNSVKIAALMFSEKYGILVRTPDCGELLRRITEEYNG